MAGSADAIGSGQTASALSGGPAAASPVEPEADRLARTYRLYDREAGFTLAAIASFGLLLAFGPLHEPILLVLWALVVTGGLFAAQLILTWRRGGLVQVDPLSREISWSRPSSDGPTKTWRFDEITALDTPRKGCTNVVRIEASGRKLTLQVPADRADAIADWLEQTLAPIAPEGQLAAATTGAATGDAE